MDNVFSSYALTVTPDVCKANGKDVNAVELLRAMATYGKVEKLSDVIARATAPLKQTIDNLVKRIDSIEEQELDNFDMDVLRVVRQIRKKELEGKDVQIAELTQELKSVVEFHEKKHQELTDFVTAFTEKYTENYADK